MAGFFCTAPALTPAASAVMALPAADRQPALHAGGQMTPGAGGPSAQFLVESGRLADQQISPRGCSRDQARGCARAAHGGWSAASPPQHPRRYLSSEACPHNDGLACLEQLLAHGHFERMPPLPVPAERQGDVPGAAWGAVPVTSMKAALQNAGWAVRPDAFAMHARLAPAARAVRILGAGTRAGVLARESLRACAGGPGSPGAQGQRQGARCYGERDQRGAGQPE